MQNNNAEMNAHMMESSASTTARSSTSAINSTSTPNTNNQSQQPQSSLVQQVQPGQQNQHPPTINMAHSNFGPIARAIISPMPVDMSFLSMTSPMGHSFPYALASPAGMNMNMNLNQLQMAQMNQQGINGFGTEIPKLPVIPQMPHGLNYNQMTTDWTQAMMNINAANFDQLPTFELPPDLKQEQTNPNFSGMEAKQEKKKRGRKRKVFMFLFLF